MAQSHVILANHLMGISSTFDNGVVYYYTHTKQIAQLVELVRKNAQPLDYGIPTSGTVFLRLNYKVRSKEIPTPLIGGGAITQPDVAMEILDVIKQVSESNPGRIIEEGNLSATILNDWGRYSLVFELDIMVK